MRTQHTCNGNVHALMCACDHMCACAKAFSTAGGASAPIFIASIFFFMDNMLQTSVGHPCTNTRWVRAWTSHSQMRDEIVEGDLFFLVRLWALFSSREFLVTCHSLLRRPLGRRHAWSPSASSVSCMRMYITWNLVSLQRTRGC